MIFRTDVTSDSLHEDAGHDMAVFPLAGPSIATPGAILAGILLTDNHLHAIPSQPGTTAVLIGILAATLLLMLSAAPVLRVIGTIGASILVRVMGMILAALSVEFVVEALGLPHGPGGG